MARSEREEPPLESELVALWEDNGIYINLPEKELGSRENDDMSWDRYIIGDEFEIIYSIRYDGTGDVITIIMPSSYRPMADAMILVLAHMGNMSLDEAKELYGSLHYNMIDYQASRTIGNLYISLYEYDISHTLQIFRSFS